MARRPEVQGYLFETLQKHAFDDLRRAIIARGMIVFATGNDNKASEMEQILEAFGANLRIETRRISGLIEIQGTLEQVCARKAVDAYRRASEVMKPEDLLSNGIMFPIGVEDTSLEVIALGNFPGPYVKALFEGAEDLEGCRRLVALAQGTDRRAIARTMLGFPIDSQNAILIEGRCEGMIASEVMPGDYGFGWDAAFIPVGFDASFAKIHPQIKNTISMRSDAVRRLYDFLYPAVDE